MLAFMRAFTDGACRNPTTADPPPARWEHCFALRKGPGEIRLLGSEKARNW
jgi:hypothetical protein